MKHKAAISTGEILFDVDDCQTVRPIPAQREQFSGFGGSSAARDRRGAGGRGGRR